VPGLLALHSWNCVPQLLANRLAPSCDVVHVSNLVLRAPNRAALSSTIHDCISSFFPEFHTPAQVAADRDFSDRVLRRAAGLIAVSEATRVDAIRTLKLSPDRIHVIHPGVPRSYGSVSQEAIDRIRATWRLPDRYFLSVGTIEPRKNIDRLLDAWMSLPSGFRQEHALVVAGMSGWKSDHTLLRLSQLTREDSGVRWLGYVPEAAMPALTAGALSLIYPSLYEGFGIPVAQAMAAGCPVITSNASSLPEIAGGAALLIDPLSHQAISGAMRRMAESPVLRTKLRAAGLVRSQAFTWEEAAERSLDYFANLAGR
jgi:glycosyltransferase involved in cell wall biosynthesis